MAIQTIRITLRGARSYPGKVFSEDFVVPLRLDPLDCFPAIGAEAGIGETSVIDLYRSSVRDFHQEDPDDAFASRLNEAFEMIAGWLARRPKVAFNRFSELGIQVTLLINLWINNDQMDLILPPCVLVVCGELGIGVVIISNE